MADSLEDIQIEISANAENASAALDKLIVSLQNVGSAIKGISVSPLSKLSKNLANVADSVGKIDSNALDKVSKLSTSLASLKGVKLSSTFAKNLGGIADSMSSLKDVPESAFENLERMADSFAKMEKVDLAGFASAQKAFKASEKGVDSASLTTRADTVGFRSETAITRAPEGARGLEELKTQIANTQKSVKALSENLNKTVAEQGENSTAAKKVADALKTETRHLNELTTKLNAASTAANTFSKSQGNGYTEFLGAGKELGGLIGKVAGVASAGAFLKKAVQESMDYVENLNLFTVSMGKYTEQALDFAEQVNVVMGIDTSEWVRAQGVFMTLGTGFGVASDRAYTMSQNLTQLSYDISSLFNLDFDEAIVKVQSAFAGELEPLRRLGFDLSMTKLQETADDLNLGRAVSEMTQAEKAELRYYTVMTQVTTAHNDMARTLENPANQMRILQTNITQCTRAIGNMFIPALNAILPAATAVMQVIRDLANELASLFGFSIPEIDYSGVDYGEDAVEGLDDNLNSARGSAKELKKQLLGFDEINNITPQTSSGSGSGSVEDTGTGFDFELPTYDFLEGAVTQKLDEWKSFFDTLGNIAKGAGVVKLASSITKIAAELKTLELGKLIGIITSGGKITDLSTAISTLATDSKLFTFLEKVAQAIEKIKNMKVIKGLTEVLTKLPILGSVIEKVGGKLIPFVGEVLMVVDAIKLAGEAVDFFTQPVSLAFDALDELGVTLPEANQTIANNLDNLNETFQSYDLSGEIINEEDIVYVDGMVTELRETIVNGLDYRRQQVLADLDMLGGLIGLTAEQIEEQKINVNDYFDGMIEDVNNQAQEILDISKNAYDRGGRLTKTEQARITEIVDGWYEDNLIAAGVNADKIAEIEDARNSHSLENTQKVASETIIAARTARDETVAAIEDERDRVLASLDVVAEANGWTADEISAAKDVINASYDSQADAAEVAFTKTQKRVSDAMGDMAWAVDMETGEMATQWEITQHKFEDFGDAFDEAMGGAVVTMDTTSSGIMLSSWQMAKQYEESSEVITNATEEVARAWRGLKKNIESSPIQGKVSYTSTVASGSSVTFGKYWSARAYASGGFPTTGQLFIAREAGAEMVGAMGNQTAVANNQQIVQGITAGVSQANSQQNALLREQNSLLRQLLEKNIGVTLDGQQLAASINRASRVQGRSLVTV